ncbi:MAG: M1 family metallopeptidase [Gemmatimonadota bacterium]
MKRARVAVGSLFAFGMLLGFAGVANAQSWLHPDEEGRTNQSIFRAIDEWPDANRYRGASGAPGPEYWQQQVDYVIETTLDTVEHVVSGSERIAYHNNSPDILDYLWVQLDQNVRSLEHSRAYQTRRALPEEISERARRFLGVTQFDGGHQIARVQFVSGDDRLDADYRINGTLMKVHLLDTLEPGESVELEIDWSFRVPDWGRGGKEQVSDGWIYELAQWFPRLAVYDDVNGWQTDQFLGRGEFYLEFGNYDVRINVPANHIVEATGVLQNPNDVLTETQRERLERAYESRTPVYIVGPDEVMTAGSRPAQSGMLTWHYKADDVRDFAWASSKTFVWDAAGYKYDEGQEPIAVHSLYPRDAMPLWNEISTPAVIQTLETYGRMAFEYPYPKASNVNGPAGGMEYPMLAFCGARPRGDGEISDGLRWALMGVTIHEVGHNWFPMIVNSDERKWTWMDEGLNTFLQHYAEVEMDPDFGRWRSSPSGITEYMRDPDQVPIMTHSDLIHKDFGNNGYAKPAAGLSILRETVLGPEVFDDAFSGYAKRWMFKKPQPADFFRSLDEGAGEDMAWMWRGWFYTTHANDQAVADVGRQDAEELLGSTDQGAFYYRVRIVNEGGLVMPIIMDVEYESGRTQRVDLPVDVWRYDEKEFLYGFFADEPVVRLLLDPDEELADIDTDNNLWLAPTS